MGHFGLVFGLQLATTESREARFLSVEKLLARPGSGFGIGNRKTIRQIFRDKGGSRTFHSGTQEDRVDPASRVVCRREARVGFDPQIGVLQT